MGQHNAHQAWGQSPRKEKHQANCLAKPQPYIRLLPTLRLRIQDCGEDAPSSCLAGRQSPECSTAQAYSMGHLLGFKVLHSSSGCLLLIQPRNRADDVQITLRHFLSLEATGPAARPLKAPDSTGLDDRVVSCSKILGRPTSTFQLSARGPQLSMALCRLE